MNPLPPLQKISVKEIVVDYFNNKIYIEISIFEPLKNWNISKSEHSSPARIAG